MSQNISVPVPTTGGVDARLSKLPGDYINLRAQPSANASDVGDLHLGDVVHYFPDVPSGDWVYVVPMANGVRTGTPGWVSRQLGAVGFTPISADPVPPPTEPIIEVSLSTYNKLLAAQLLFNQALAEVKPPASGGGF